jgi:hypothetical protein
VLAGCIVAVEPPPQLAYVLVRQVRLLSQGFSLVRTGQAQLDAVKVAVRPGTQVVEQGSTRAVAGAHHFLVRDRGLIYDSHVVDP